MIPQYADTENLERTKYLFSPLTDDQESLVREYGKESYEVAKFIKENPRSLLRDEIDPESAKSTTFTSTAIGFSIGIPVAPIVGVITAEAATAVGLTSVGVGLAAGGTAGLCVLGGAGGLYLLAKGYNMAKRISVMRETTAFREWKTLREKIIKDRSLRDLIRRDPVLKDFLCPISGDLPLIPVRRKNGSKTEVTFDLDSLKEYVEHNPGSGYYRGEPAFEIEDGVVKDMEIDYPHLNTMIFRLQSINKRLERMTSATSRAFIDYNRELISKCRESTQSAQRAYAKQNLDEISSEIERERKGSVEEGEDLMFQLSGREEEQKERNNHNPYDASLMKEYVYDSWECTLAFKKKFRINPEKRTFTFVKTHSVSLEYFDQVEREKRAA